MIRYFFEYSLEKGSSLLFEFESAIEVFLNLLETRVVLCCCLYLMIRVILQTFVSATFIIVDR